MKILFIPGQQGDETSERMPQLIKALKKHHELIFLTPKENWIKKRAFWGLRAWERFHLTQELIRNGKKLEGIDLVFCKDYMHAFPGLLIARHLKKPCVWESEGSMKAFWEDSHKYAGQVLPWMFLEKWLAKRVDRMITVTQRDCNAYIQQGANPSRIHIIPVCIRTELQSKKTKEEARQLLKLSPKETYFLFFSNFDYLPNKAALNFLNEKVAPLLPGKLLLCGKGNLPKNLHPNIEYRGFVPLSQLYDLIKASDIGLAPIWEANGTLTKVLDMLVHGTPTIITNVIQKGIFGLQDGTHALVAQNQDDFIQKTLHLAQDRVLQKKLTESAAMIVYKNHDWGLYEEKFLEIVQDCGKKHV